MKISFISLGCSKNTVDTEKYLNHIKQMGFEPVIDSNESDVVVVNTCGFIKDALVETEEVCREMVQLKQNNRGKKIFIVGCAVNRQKKKLEELFPDLDGFYSLKEMNQLFENLTLLNKNQKKSIQGNREIAITLPHYAYLKIAEGCSRSCSYCTIPSIRGKYCSVPIDELVDEATKLVQRGCVELCLIAQDTTFYGVDIARKPLLVDLLKKLVQIKGLKWIRLMYGYPQFLSKELMQFISNEEKMIGYVDLPIQHSHPDILKKMSRSQTFDVFDSFFNEIRKTKKDICLRTTIIVGFPGETEEHFNHLKQYVQLMKFDRLGVFQYQNESGTASYEFGDQLSQKVIRKRYEEIMTIQQKIHFKKNKSLIGKKLSVIIDGTSSQNGVYIGRTKRDAPDIDSVIYVISDQKLHSGQICRVKVDSCHDYDLTGYYESGYDQKG